MSSASDQSSLPTSATVRDIFLWRKKKQSVVVLLTATATWVLLEVYQFNFLTVISWLAMFVFASLFLYGNVLRLLGKEPPDLSGFGVTEKSALEMANSVRAWSEEGIRWMFRVAAEGDLFSFAGTAAALWLLSLLGSCFDLLTFLYTGVVMGMTIPAIYVKYEDNIKRSGEWVKAQWKRYHDMVDEKVVKNIKNKVTGGTWEEKVTAGREEKEEKVQ